MSMKLRELIKGVRSCKTAQEEREAIAKECALIRTSFKEGESSYRARNVAKLLYIHMLGYPTHFGQMECLKLIASPKFHEKRVGYLGLTQLLDENTEILMLVTNSIKNDINNPNPFISGTALCALGNIGNHEMCLALSREVQTLLAVDNPLIRKKAALCAMRIIKKVDDIEDKFNSSVTTLLEDKNHGVMLSTCSLLIHLLEANPEYVSEFKHVPNLLIKTLKAMLMSGYANASEYDFGGVVDPFVQVKILKLIRLFASITDIDQINDLLAQIATNTDATKNAGNAVLYECVQTIMALPGADNGLRVLGINILGKFLANKDSNIKYVALQMLQKIVALDMKAVQRHRSTVLACLRDSDVSIRKRALDVASSLVTADNAQAVIAELIGHLGQSSEEDGFKNDLASRICMCIDKYAPDRKWHVDHTFRVLLLAGNDVADEDVIFSLCHVVAGGDAALHQYAATKAFFTLCEPPEDSRDSLTMAGVWIIGEFGHLAKNFDFTDILNLMDTLVRETLLVVADQAASKAGGNSSVIVCEYIVCAVTKLFVKFGHPPALAGRVIGLLRRFQGSLFLDLQQRVCEFLEILSPQWDPQTRAGIMDTMPCRVSSSMPSGNIAEMEVPANAHELLAYIRDAEKPQMKVIKTISTKQPAVVKTADLFDLLGESTVIPASIAPNKVVSEDLLNDMFS